MTNMLTRILVAVAMLFALPAAAFAQAQPQAAQAAATEASDALPSELAEGYVLGKGDVVEVVVLGRDEFRPRVQVQNDGTIQLPFLGSVPAAEKTVLTLRDDVTKALKSGGYYANPIVNVAVVSYASRYVIVLGEVGAPGLVPIDRAYRVSEILARVGGPRDSGADTLSIRRANGEEIQLALRDIATGTTDQDPFVNPGDKLFVPPAKTFYIYGQINAPGTYKVEREMTLRMALARSGGMTSMGSEKRVKVFRDGTEIKKFNINDPIKGGDVIVVGERFF